MQEQLLPQGQRCIGKDFFYCNTPAYAFPLFRTHTMTPDNLLNVDIKDIPVRFLQSAGNISTSHITAFLELILKPIIQTFAETAYTNFANTAASISYTCSTGKTA